ncbi:hypothetical protein D3C85_1228260 [compost metagenome]
MHEHQPGQVGHPLGTGLLPFHPVDVQQVAHGIEAQGGHVAVAVAQQRLPEGQQHRAGQLQILGAVAVGLLLQLVGAALGERAALAQQAGLSA